MNSKQGGNRDTVEGGLTFEIYTLSMKRHLKVCLSILTLTGCINKNKEKMEILHEGLFTVKARSVDGKREGKTEIYNSAGKLGGIVNYKNDLKSGMTVHYFPNGVVSDSIEYVCEKPQGFWRHYNDDGSPLHTNYYYFGLEFGPDAYYNNRDSVLSSFYFLNFERNHIVECSYDLHGNLDSIKKLNLQLVVEEKNKGNIPMLQIFAYLPTIPLAELSYSIGMAQGNTPEVVDDKSKKSRKLYDIQSSHFFIDTLLTGPPPRLLLLSCVPFEGL